MIKMNKKIHELSAITTLPEFDIFSVPPTQQSIEKTFVTEHRPISTLNSTSLIQFQISTGVDEYVLLRDTLLHVQLKVNIKKGAANIVAEDWEKIAPANNFLHSLFRHVDVEVGGMSITASPQTYAYKAYFETEFGYTQDAKDSHLSSAGYYPDTDEKTKYETSRTTLITPSPIHADGKGKHVDLMGKLHIDLAFQPKAILGGTKIKITLVPNDPKFYMWTTDPLIVPTVKFESAALYVTRAKLSYPLVEAHNLALNKGTAKYPIMRGVVRTFTVSTGTMSENIENAISGQIPRRMFLALVSNKAFNGDLAENPYNFKHYDLNFLTASIDGEQFPSVAYTPNFSTGLFMREFLGFFEALNMITSDSAMITDREDYNKGNTIFGFNFGPDTTDDISKAGYVNPIRKGSVRISLKFSKALPEPINVLLYCEYDSLIQIDENRKPITDYL